jgi:two-component system aerobic respiration control sensor histidine kinase ArcB
VDKNKEFANYNWQLLDAIPVSIYIKDTQGIYQGCNSYMLKILGLSSREDIKGRTDRTLSWQSSAENLEAIDKLVMETRRAHEIEECADLMNGETRIFLTTKTPLFNDIRDVIGLIGVSVDITNIKEMQLELDDALEKAKVSEKAKKEFLYNMRHDIRTPFSSIMGIVEHLRNSEKDDERRGLLSCAYNSANEHLRMLNEVLEIVHLEEGAEGNVKNKIFNLHNILMGLNDLMSPLASERKLKFNISIDGKVPEKIIGDSFRTHRILMNLLSNAIKFTNRGHVGLSVCLIKESLRNIVVQFNVEDTGIGIPEDKKGIIFERFTRVTPSYKGIYEGRGLGLRIVSKFLEDMGGEVYSVDNREGGGSIFKILIPYRLSLIEQKLVEA